MPAAQNDVIPKCPGPFGGTTVLVLPSQLKQEEVAAWRSLEERDPLAAASRFHRVRIAIASGDGALPDVLKALLTENRKNVLVVPATFYADAAWLHQLRQAVEDLNNRMTIRWQPGLGSRRGILLH